jgi:hypothetical protein
VLFRSECLASSSICNLQYYEKGNSISQRGEFRVKEGVVAYS